MLLSFTGEFFLKHQEKKRNNSVSLRTDAPFKDENAMNRSARRVLLRLFLLALPLVVLTLFATSLLSSSSSNADSVHNTAALTFASEGKRYLSFQEPLSTLENPTTRVTPSSLSGWLDGWMEFFLLLLYDLYNILLDVGFLFISTRLSSTNGTDSLNLLLLHRSRSSNRDAILLYPPSGWGFDLLLLPC